MYYPDLSIGPHLCPDKETVMVGWLAPGQPFPTGAIPPTARDLLRLYARELEHGTFGTYRCHICDAYADTGEIHLEGSHRIYIAPRMISHYVDAHQYLPPAEYVQAILATPIQNGQPVLQVRRPVAHPWTRLTVRQIVARYKRPTIVDDPRWHAALADTTFPILRDEGAFGNPMAAQMVALLKDPHYNHESS